MIKYLLMMILSSLVIVGYENDVEYFPKGKLISDNGSYENNTIEYYSLRLNAIQEPSLWEFFKKKQQIESYRLLMDRPFQDLICIRIKINNPMEIEIYTKVFKRDLYSEEKGYPGDFVINRKKIVSESDIKSLLQQIDEVKFWELKSDDFPVMSVDSAICIFEGVNDDKYHAVKIPMFNDSLRERIIQLTDLFLALGDF